MGPIQNIIQLGETFIFAMVSSKFEVAAHKKLSTIVSMHNI